MTSHPQDPNTRRESNPELESMLAAEVTRKEAAELLRAWELAGRVTLEPPVAQEEAARMRTALLAHAGSSEGRRRLRWIPRVAAVVVLVAVSAYLLGRPARHRAGPGEPTIVSLRDGSVVRLRAGSSFHEYGRGAVARGGRLLGEAHFEVVPGARGFRVATDDALITVLGTRFSVRSWGTAAGTSVHLAEGSVRLNPHGSSEATFMEAGESVTVAESVVTPSVSYPANVALDWMEGDLVFADAPLEDVLGDVARRFGVRVSLSDQPSGQLLVNGAFRRPPSAEAVIRDITFYLGLSYRPTSDGFEVFRPQGSMN